jgi:biotin operon repressor
MISKIWTKPQTQQAIKSLRDAGLTVDKLNAGYECKINDKLLFKAMIGSQGYLVRYDANLFM